MKSFVENGILHMVYQSKQEMNTALKDISYSIERNKQTYEGHNFPYSSFLHIFEFPKNKKRTKEHKEEKDVEYVIGYVEGDEVSRMHELYHAKYYMDKSHREKVKKLWDSLSKKKQDEITRGLNNMGYPQHLHLDEFQAYHFSEPIRKGKNFWNI